MQLPHMGHAYVQAYQHIPRPGPRRQFPHIAQDRNDGPALSAPPKQWAKHVMTVGHRSPSASGDGHACVGGPGGPGVLPWARLVYGVKPRCRTRTPHLWRTARRACERRPTTRSACAHLPQASSVTYRQSVTCRQPVTSVCACAHGSSGRRRMLVTCQP